MRIRRAAQAGRFYPGGEDELREQVTGYLAAAPPVESSASVRGIISPHAGYLFSGATAGQAFRAIDGARFSRVIVSGPSHHYRFRGASVYDGDCYQTSLGSIPIDRALIDRVRTKTRLLHYDLKYDVEEHAIEVELPFLQVQMDGFQLTPMLFSGQTLDEARELAKAMVQALHELGELEDTLFVASSDLYHGYSHEECLTQNQLFQQGVEQFDPSRFYQSIRQKEYMACGHAAILFTLLAVAEAGATGCRVLSHTTSRDVRNTGSSYVVGYAAGIMA